MAADSIVYLQRILNAIHHGDRFTLDRSLAALQAENKSGGIIPELEIGSVGGHPCFVVRRWGSFAEEA